MPRTRLSRLKWIERGGWRIDGTDGIHVDDLATGNGGGRDFLRAARVAVDV